MGNLELIQFYLRSICVSLFFYLLFLLLNIYSHTPYTQEKKNIHTFIFHNTGKLYIRSKNIIPFIQTTNKQNKNYTQKIRKKYSNLHIFPYSAKHPCIKMHSHTCVHYDTFKNKKRIFIFMSLLHTCFLLLFILYCRCKFKRF